MSSNKGIYTVSKTELEKFANGRSQSIRCSVL